MAVTVAFEPQPDYLLATFTGDVVERDSHQLILDASYKAEEMGLNGVLFDLSSLSASEPKLQGIYDWVQWLSHRVPKGLRYAFLVRPDQMKRREFSDAFFWNNGLKVKTTSDRQEAIAWVTAKGPIGGRFLLPSV